MAGKSPTLAEMTGLQLEGLPNSLEIGQKIWHNRDRIKDAYIRDRRYDRIGNSLAYCPWDVCSMDDTKAHAHLHNDAGNSCEWLGCVRKEVHVHKFKPPPSDPAEEVDPTGRYERVKDVMKEILGEQYQEEPLAKNIYLKLEEERIAEEVEKEQKATRLADAERAGDEAKREFEQAAAVRRARRADDRKIAKEAEQDSERKMLERKAARAQLILEAETGNELERTFTKRDLSSGPSNNKAVVEGDTTLGKRKRVNNDSLSQVSSSPESSPPEPLVANGNKLIDEEALPDTKKQSASIMSSTLEAESDSATSDLTLYSRDQLDAIMEHAEIVRHDPASLPIRTREIPDLEPDIVFDNEPVSKDSETQLTTGFSAGHSDSLPTSADEGIQPQNGCVLGSMPPPLPSPFEMELADEDIEMEEQLARRRQIQWVLKIPKYKKAQQKAWAEIKIYEDIDSVDEVI